MLDVFERCGEATMRLDKVICLGAAISDSDGESMSDDLQEFLDMSDWTELERAFGPLPEHLLHAYESEIEEVIRAEFVRWFVDSERLGFLVQAATPVRRQRGSHVWFSWGSYYTHWVYANSFEEALDKAIAWAQERGEQVE